MDGINNKIESTTPYTAEWEDQIDLAFMQRVIGDVTMSCSLPNPIPLEKIPDLILQAAQWFWQNDDSAVEQRFYLIQNSEFCKGNVFNKIVQLPQQIVAIQGVYKTSNVKYGALGDFSVERMLMSSYSMYGGVGSINGGLGANGGMTGYNLTDLTVSLYEVDTFDQMLNPTLSYNYNMFSTKLIVYGDLGPSDVVIDCWKRLPLQDLYQNYYFFRMCVCLVKRALSQIYGTFTFRYPGGVEINYDNFKSDADDEIDRIKEHIEEQHACDYFFQPNIM